MKKTIGILLLLSPFIGTFIFGFLFHGWKVLIPFGVAFIIIVIVSAGIYLIED